MSPVAPFLIFERYFCFKRHAERFEGDSFKKTRSVLKAPRLKFSKKVLPRLSMYNMLSH